MPSVDVGEELIIFSSESSVVVFMKCELLFSVRGIFDWVNKLLELELEDDEDLSTNSSDLFTLACE